MLRAKFPASLMLTANQKCCWHSKWKTSIGAYHRIECWNRLLTWMNREVTIPLKRYCDHESRASWMIRRNSLFPWYPFSECASFSLMSSLCFINHGNDCQFASRAVVNWLSISRWLCIGLSGTGSCLYRWVNSLIFLWILGVYVEQKQNRRVVRPRAFYSLARCFVLRLQTHSLTRSIPLIWYMWNNDAKATCQRIMAQSGSKCEGQTSSYAAL